MTALPLYRYADPAIVVEQDEARTCKGCCLKQTWKIGHTATESCLLGKKIGKRCKKYQEAK